MNLAYEAATADLNDVNMIDPYHLEAYGVTTVNYNRDVEIYPVLSAIFEKILGEGNCPYKSPTDMGVNMAGYCISDDAAVREAACDEIVRRYYSTMCDYRKGRVGQSAVSKLELLMKQAGLSPERRKVACAAAKRSEDTDGQPAVAIELPDGRIVTGKTSTLLGAASAALLNSIKTLAGIEKSVHLIAPEIIEPLQRLKTGTFGNKNPRLHSDEILIARSICAVCDETAKKALECLPELSGCEAHSTVILSQVDEELFRKLGMNLTCDPVYDSNKMFHK